MEQAKRVRSSPPEEEEAAQTTCDDELITTPIPHPLGYSGGGGRKSGVKLSWGRREGWERKVFLRFGFISLYPTLICLVIIQSFFFSPPSSVCFALDCNWRVISPCPNLDPRAFHRFFSPVQLSRWE